MAEVIGGDSWERLVKKYIFDPLGMTSSSFMTTYDNNMVELVKRGLIKYLIVYHHLNVVSYILTHLEGVLLQLGVIKFVSLPPFWFPLSVKLTTTI
jgi:hypothetical protein